MLAIVRCSPDECNPPFAVASAMVAFALNELEACGLFVYSFVVRRCATPDPVDACKWVTDVLEAMPVF